MEQQISPYVESFSKLVEECKKREVLCNEEVLPGFLMCVVEDFHDDFVNNQNTADEAVAYILKEDARRAIIELLRERGVLDALMGEALAAIEDVLMTSGLMRVTNVIKKSFFGERAMVAWAIPNPSVGFPEDYNPEMEKSVLDISTFQGVLDAIKDTSSYFRNEKRVQEFVNNERIWTFLEYLVLKNYLGRNERPMWSYDDQDTLRWTRVESWILYHQLFQDKLGWKPSKIPALITARWEKLVTKMVEEDHTFRVIPDHSTRFVYLTLGEKFYYRLSSLRQEIKKFGVLADDLDDHDDREPEDDK